MKPDKTLIMILVPPFVALALCILYPVVFHETRTFTPEQPEFLTYVDKLGTITIEGGKEAASADIRDVFRHEWTLPAAELAAVPGAPAPEPIRVSMIVEAGSNSFCVINSKKMYLNDKTDQFRITAIGQDQVTILYKNGTRETHHVKVY